MVVAARPEPPVVLDRDVRRLAGGRVLLGGDPGRLLRLGPGGPAALQQLADGRPRAAPLQDLARTLVDGGLAHPRPGPAADIDVTVVVPVRDRCAELDRCLAALGRTVPVLVVDDGSRDPDAVAEVCRRHGAQVLALPRNAGPAAARNAGFITSGSPFVAFVDSDCAPPPGWLSELAGHLHDPAVAAVAPRVRARPGAPGLLARYALARGPLDLGDREGSVLPGRRVSYVPTAALLVRRDALAALRGPFDHGLRYGEDVDLVWRLHDAGWRVRYDPRVVVLHDEPTRWPDWLRRRHHYGTSAGPLAQRHGARLAPLVLPPWPAAAWLFLSCGCPTLAAIVSVVPLSRLYRALRRARLPRRECVDLAVRLFCSGVLAVAEGLGGAGLVVSGPIFGLLLVNRRARLSATVALVVPPLLQWARARPGLDPLRWTVLRLVDDLAYASGVWRSCWTARTLQPLRPRSSRPR